MFDKLFSQSQQSWASWGKLWEEQLGRLESVQQQATRLHKQGAEHMASVIDDTAKLAQTSLEQLGQVGEQWQTMTLDFWRRTAQVMTSEPVNTKG
ncbi:MAG: hypothetical protein AAGF11_11705 [Myxococcota bacterium]